MIISRTPFRISFFGGGSDYESWYSRHGGSVLSTSIAHYCYITVRWLPPFHTEKSRIVWSKIESVQNNADIEHHSVRACLQSLGITEGIEIHHSGDLPARSGLGSSSSFTVGLLNALYSLQGSFATSRFLASKSVHIERDVMKENVGIQDQIAASFGGFNHTTIEPDGSFTVERLDCPEKLGELQSHLMLFFTGISRTASDIAAEQIRAQVEGATDTEMHQMQTMVAEGMAALLSSDITDFGRLLHESWMIKRTLAKNIAPPIVDEIYESGRKAGAIGGKLLGAGGGGFMLFFAKPEDHQRIRAALPTLIEVPVKFDTTGSQIIFNDTENRV